MRGFALEHLLASTRNMQGLFGQAWVENEKPIADAVTKMFDEQLTCASGSAAVVSNGGAYFDGFIEPAARRPLEVQYPRQ
jgi:hypothetical protein